VLSTEIRMLVEKNAGNPDGAVRELIAAANREGGKDNVTAVVIEGEQFTASAPAAPAVRKERGIAGVLIAVLATLAIVAAGLYFSRNWWMPKPVVIRARTITAGQGSSYATIAAALADANPGDRVEVLAGEYAEPIQLKSGVSLESRVPREAVLRPASAVGPASGPAVAAQRVKDARFTGFRIAADAQPPVTGILIVDSSVAVEQVEIDGAAIGMEVRGASRVSLVGDAVRDCQAEAVLLSGPVEAWISHNSFQRNKGGLVARDGAKPALVGNVFEKNPIVLPPEISMDTVREHNFVLDARTPVRAGGRKKE
jgi:hypothetical protein